MPDAQPALRRELRLWHLVLFNVSAVAGIRWLAAAAQVGPGSLTLWLLAALTFFLPSALVIAVALRALPRRRRILYLDQARFRRLAWISGCLGLFREQHPLLPDAAALGRRDGQLMFGASGVKYSENAALRRSRHDRGAVGGHLDEPGGAASWKVAQPFGRRLPHIWLPCCSAFLD